MGMKALYVCLVVLFFTLLPVGRSTPVFAQDQQPPSAEDIVAKMQSALNLTPDQVSAVTPIIEKYSSKREELRQSMEDGTADKDSIHSQMKELRVDEAQELSQVLSADQMSQWKQMMSQMHKHGGEGSAGGANNSGGSSGSGESN